MKSQILATFFAIYFEIAICQENIIGDSVYACKILKDSTKNVVLSPLSINTAFGMLYVGAKGESKSQIKRAMFNTLSDDQLLNAVSSLSDVFNARSEGYNITLVNRLYAKSDFPFLESYTNALRTKFSSDIVPVPATADQINKWVAEKTNDKIKNLIPNDAVNEGTKLILVNALHFKAQWFNQFENKFTIDQPFHSQPSKSANVKMMQIFNEEYQYLANEKVEVLGMSFRVLDFGRSGPNLKMFFVLPKERYGLNDFLSGIESVNSLTALFRNADHTALFSKVAIPKFKIEFELKLNEAMLSTGITDIFDPTKADLSAITGNKDFYVSTAIHKGYIEVAEEGVEAAAATAIFMVGSSGVVRPRIEFIADHPFLFAIVDTRSYTTLFVGKYIN